MVLFQFQTQSLYLEKDEDGTALSIRENMNVAGFEINLQVESLNKFNVLISCSFQNVRYVPIYEKCCQQCV